MPATLTASNSRPTRPTGESTRNDLYTTITAKIVEQLENGVRPWHQPWTVNPSGAVSRPLRANGVPYRGVNVVVLWLTAVERGFESPYFLTFNQCKELGGSVKKGEKSTTVVYASSFEKKEQDKETGEELTRSINFLRSYNVFNAGQCANLPAHYIAQAVEPRNRDERLDHAEHFFAKTGITVNTGGSRAYYSPASDSIQMPAFERFESRTGYYATLSHEMLHASGAEKRLNRTFGKRFGDDVYSFEELVAELGSAFVCADLGMTPEVMPDHAAYLSAWLKILKADSRAIFTAAAHAERAAEFLGKLQVSDVTDSQTGGE